MGNPNQGVPFLNGSYFGQSGGGGAANTWGAGGIIQSHDVRPGATYGASITPGNNAYSAYVTVLGTPTAFDCYQIDVTIQGIGVSATAKDAICTIGVDPAGGTNYTDTIQHLLCGYAGALGNALTGGITFRFPLYIKAGSTIGAKVSVNNATVGTAKVAVILYGKPTNLAMHKYGTVVTTFGATTASSNGTAVTAGTASEGTLTQVGGAIAAPIPFHWVVASANANDAAQNNSQRVTDLAIGPNSGAANLVVVNQWGLEDSAENNSASYIGANYIPNAGDLVFVRIQSASATTAYSAIVYGVS